MKIFLYSSVYSFHLFLISSDSVRSITFLSCIEPIFAWNVLLLSLIFLKRSHPRKWNLSLFPLSPFYLPWNDGTRCHDLSFLNLSLSQLFTLLFHPHQEIVQSKWGMDWLLETQLNFQLCDWPEVWIWETTLLPCPSVPCKVNEAEDAKIVLVLCLCFIEMINYNSQMGNKKIEKWRNFFLENERRKGPKEEKESKVWSLPH